jgi:hypothetical protein
MINLIKTIARDCATGPGGEVFDPARVIGYGTAIAGVAVFLFNSVWAVTHGEKFDQQAYGMGFAAVCGGIMAIGIGVGAKAHTEPKP